uniref:Uncharacterized protein n=1 Tax=Anguilla anguilla TaxID=7936 RepID=A0A0E9UCA0_ANGAN
MNSTDSMASYPKNCSD